MHRIDIRPVRTALFAAGLLGVALAASAAPRDNTARPIAAGETSAPVRMIRTSGNQSPWIYINHYITNYAVDVSVGAYDPDGSVVYLVVDFGDGATVSSGGGTIATQHVYAAPGTYTISVTALDNEGGVGFETRSVWISGSDST